VTVTRLADAARKVSRTAGWRSFAGRGVNGPALNKPDGEDRCLIHLSARFCALRQ
jgi:hypothetical protein